MPGTRAATPRVRGDGRLSAPHNATGQKCYFPPLYPQMERGYRREPTAVGVADGGEVKLLDRQDTRPKTSLLATPPHVAHPAAPSSPRFFERGLLVLIALYLLTLPLVTHDLRAADEIEYFAYLRSAAFDRDLDFLNEYSYFYNRFPAKYSCVPPPGQTDCKSFKSTFIDTVTATGKRPNFGPIGTAVLWSPFYLGGHLVAVVMRALGSDVALDGYSKPYIRAITLGSAIYALLGLLLAYRLCRTLVSERAAFWGTLAIWLGTPVIFYSHLAPGYSHAASLFAVSLFLFLWMRWRDTLTIPRAIAIGVVGGLIAMIREQDALFLMVPALYAGLGLIPLLRRADWRGILRSIVTVGTLGLAAIVTFIPQLLTYQVLNGEPRPNTDVSDKMNLVPPHFWDVMLDPAHALPYWSPIVVLAVVGLALLTWRDPRLGLALLVGFVVTWYINGAINTWTTAGSFGARRFLNCTPIFVVGLPTPTKRSSPACHLARSPGARSSPPSASSPSPGTEA
jgi:hypothetical protein